MVQEKKFKTWGQDIWLEVLTKKSITEKKKNREEKYKRARTSVGQEKGEFKILYLLYL